MSALLAPVEAYRRDLARAGRASRAFGDEDAGWLLLAHVVTTRAAGGAPASGASDLGPDASDVANEHANEVATDATRVARDVALAPALDDARLIAAVMAAAVRMENAGALHLAAATLASLARALDDERQPLARGRVLAQRARVERLLGDVEAAADLYTRVGRLGARHRAPELRVRADLGLGVLARMRGNYPEARRRFGRALGRAERAELGELTGLAHQAMLVAAAVARDFDTALSHGWRALAHVAGDAPREADVLLNLASLCLDAGHHDAALRGFLTAAERAGSDRVRIAATAGAAVAAARTGDRELLRGAAAAVERALSETTIAPYERAQRLLTLADAWRAAGGGDEADAAATHALERGLAVAREHGFAELIHEYESAAVRGTTTTPLGADAARVVRALATLDEVATAPERAAAVTRGHAAHTPGFS